MEWIGGGGRERGGWWRTSLSRASENGHKAVARLLNNGAGVNDSDDDGWTPLLGTRQPRPTWTRTARPGSRM
ncbi:hypothetical protein EDB80DRAFT_744272 [Ilyonectria destructans]|nr:hypothetical protein EDB80DRAFT_744272 [Ilyonectria destructans]